MLDIKSLEKSPVSLVSDRNYTHNGNFEMVILFRENYHLLLINTYAPLCINMMHGIHVYNVKIERIMLI